MKVFSALITESYAVDVDITEQEFQQFKKAVDDGKRSKEYMQLLWIIAQYPVLLQNGVLTDVLAKKKVLDADVTKDIIALVKKIGDEAKILPQNLTQKQRQYIIDNRIDANDLTLDLESKKGRDNIVKKYARLVEKLVNQYADKSPLSKEDIRLAAYEGLVIAMNTYKNPDELSAAGLTGKSSFTSWASYNIARAICQEMTDNARNVAVSRYYQSQAKEKGEEIGKEYSINHKWKDEEGNAMDMDKFFGLTDEPDPSKWTGDMGKMWKEFCTRIESKFSVRDCNILYRVWGVNGYKAEPVKDIAKELNISVPAVTQACKRIMKWAANDPALKEISMLFAESYIANKAVLLYECAREVIMADFLNDDMYMFCESITRWKDAKSFQDRINKCTDMLNVDDALYIYKCLSGEKIIDKDLAKHKQSIIKFFTELYPDKLTNAKSDLKGELDELAQEAAKLNIKW